MFAASPAGAKGQRNMTGVTLCYASHSSAEHRVVGFKVGRMGWWYPAASGSYCNDNAQK